MLKATGFKPLPLNINPGFKMCLSTSTCATTTWKSFYNTSTCTADPTRPANASSSQTQTDMCGKCMPLCHGWNNATKAMEAVKCASGDSSWKVTGCPTPPAKKPPSSVKPDTYVWVVSSSLTSPTTPRYPRSSFPLLILPHGCCLCCYPILCRLLSLSFFFGVRRKVVNRLLYFH
jgi:hypothetical protein